jgi:hypothetical protein
MSGLSLFFVLAGTVVIITTAILFRLWKTLNKDDDDDDFLGI